MAYIVPVLIVVIFLAAAFKRVKIYDEFSKGVKDAIDFTLSLLPCLAAVFMMCEVFERSTLSEKFCNLISPLLSSVGVPKELAKLILIKPFSGSGSMAYLTEIIKTYGADNYISRCACIIYSCSETIFYVSAIYFVGYKKKTTAVVIIAFISSLLSIILACSLCRIM